MRTEIRTIQNKQFKITYEIQYKKVKNITLRIEEQAKIIVSANEYVPIQKIDDFVFEKIGWILEKQQKQIQKTHRLFNGIQDGYIYLYEDKYKLNIALSNTNKVEVNDKVMDVYYREGKDPNQLIQQYLLKRCQSDFEEVVIHYHEKLSVYQFDYPTIKYRNMKGRWGSCMPSKNQITLNTRMIHYPKEFLEYVVLHELVHFIQPNHSPKFYHIIEHYMSDYKARTKLVSLED